MVHMTLNAITGPILSTSILTHTICRKTLDNTNINHFWLEKNNNNNTWLLLSSLLRWLHVCCHKPICNSMWGVEVMTIGPCHVRLHKPVFVGRMRRLTHSHMHRVLDEFLCHRTKTRSPQNLSAAVSVQKWGSWDTVDVDVTSCIHSYWFIYLVACLYKGLMTWNICTFNDIKHSVYFHIQSRGWLCIYVWANLAKIVSRFCGSIVFVERNGVAALALRLLFRGE